MSAESIPDYKLNERAIQLLDRVASAVDDFRIREVIVREARIFDFGIRTEGGLDAGQVLAEISMAGLGWVSFVPGEIGGVAWPHLFVTTDHPAAACLLSQYAGWQISTPGFFAMGSGPMRAAYAREEVFTRLNYREQAGDVVGVLEGRKLPDEGVVGYICERTGITSDRLRLLIAPTASQAGTVQVVSRSIETALHKLFELGFDVRQIRSACGSTPLPPVAADDMAGIGRTNDAILYGARVTLWVRAEDKAIAEIGPSVPADSSAAFGKPFLQVFEEAGRDFYKIDKHLFSPAEITFCNLNTGRVHRFGRTVPEVLRTSFGIE
jgi:methenyltetrahydromethanopterin cyclohydrolase